MFKKGKGDIPEKRKRRSKKKTAAGIAAVVLIAGGAGIFAYQNFKRPTAGPKENTEAQSATVEIGSIANTIVGTGNLTLDDAQAVTVPSGLKIEEVFVEDGDYVSAGTVLATVEKSSVLSAVEEIQAEMTELDERISECQKDDEENVITSSVAGRVKAIYVQEDSEVTDIMLEQGALMELSLDGLMAVDLKLVTGAQAEDEVEVLLSDGTSITGTVEKAAGSTCTVVVTDNGTDPGETVTVLNAQGEEWGSGELYIHQPLEITGTVGTVSEISVSENESVENGTELLVLEGAESEAEYQELLATREARAATLKKLLLLTKDQEITAEQSGTIQSVYVAASTDSSETSESGGTSSSAESTARASQMVQRTDTRTGSVQWMTFTSDDTETVAEEPENAAVLAADEFSDSGEVSDSGSDQEDNEPVQDTRQMLSLAVTGSGDSNASVLVVPAPKTGEVPIWGVSASDGSYTGAVTWNPSGEIFAGETSYQALVVLYASEGYMFGQNSVQTASHGTISGIQVSGDGSTLEFQIAFPQTEADQKDQGNDQNETDLFTGTGNGDENGSTGTDNNEHDSQNAGNGSGSNGTLGTGSGLGNGGSGSGSTDTGSSQTPGTGSNGTNTGSASQNAAGASGTSVQESEESEAKNTASELSEYSTDVTAFTISPDENMLLSVSVDELDINSVELGQTAVVTFDAIEDQEFEGEVTSIGNTASVNGGVAKYAVVLTVAKEEQMREGMNASATITIEKKEQVLTLPMNALQEQGDRVFVYTVQNEDGTLSGETEVTTGLSDGSTVEITEGLSQGDTVYYTRTGNTSESGGKGMGEAEGRGGGDFERDLGGDFGGFGGGSQGGGNQGGGPPGM